MKKKSTAIFLAMATALSSLSMTAFADESEDLVTIYWQWPSYGYTGSGFQAVEDALNEMMEKDIGVHVVLEPMLFSDLLNQTTLAVTSGEQLDLSLQVGTGIGTYVTNGLIQPITDYIEEYGADILEACQDSIKGVYYGGELYGIPVAYISTNSYGFMARKDLLDKYGIEYDEEKIYTLDEIEEIWEIVKEGEGDKFYTTIPVTGTNGLMLADAYCAIDYLGSSFASGALMLEEDFTNTTLVNVFATDEYAEYAERCYEWAQKGYVSADAAMNTEDRSLLLAGGNYLGYFTWTTPNTKPSIEAVSGYELVALTTVEAYQAADSVGISWQVPITSKYPEKAVEAINYIYKNQDACNLLLYGIEGVDYEVTEKTDVGTQIRYLADDVTTLAYYMPFGVYGNRLQWPVVEPTPVDMNQQLIDWEAELSEDRISPAKGFVFESDNVSEEISAVTAVINQYADIIEAGAVDPASSLPEFLSALQDAGIDTAIAEKQAQLDAWLAENN